jgi:hypothetical protein
LESRLQAVFSEGFRLKPGLQRVNSAPVRYGNEVGRKPGGEPAPMGDFCPNLPEKSLTGVFGVGEGVFLPSPFLWERGNATECDKMRHIASLLLCTDRNEPLESRLQAVFSEGFRLKPGLQRVNSARVRYGDEDRRKPGGESIPIENIGPNWSEKSFSRAFSHFIPPTM